MIESAAGIVYASISMKLEDSKESKEKKGKTRIRKEKKEERKKKIEEKRKNRLYGKLFTW